MQSARQPLGIMTHEPQLPLPSAAAVFRGGVKEGIKKEEDHRTVTTSRYRLIATTCSPCMLQPWKGYHCGSVSERRISLLSQVQLSSLLCIGFGSKRADRQPTNCHRLSPYLRATERSCVPHKLYFTYLLGNHSTLSSPCVRHRYHGRVIAQCWCKV